MNAKAAQIAHLQKKHGVNIRYQRGSQQNTTMASGIESGSHNQSRMSNSVTKAGGGSQHVQSSSVIKTSSNNNPSQQAGVYKAQGEASSQATDTAKTTGQGQLLKSS